ncbi:phosphoglycerate mutase-like protein 4 isoform X1 [Typha angustifolia]|uniref:phosphoglycerate mutase-like protein 4 isoform X1 n=1 Tax=Typha angustifolia TaxID=59011 RepID=UPI003C2FEF59
MDYRMTRLHETPRESRPWGHVASSLYRRAAWKPRPQIRVQGIGISTKVSVPRRSLVPSRYRPRRSNSDLTMSSIDPACEAIDAGIPSGFTEILVLRHGETSWNASRIIQGHLDPELNETGRRQATAVAAHLSKESKFAAIYSSDLKRAAETAQIIASSCGLPEVVLDQALRERNLGDLQGLTLRDAAKIKPKAYKLFLSSKREQEVPGGGESLDQLSVRCVSSLQRIAAQHKGERVIVVTHGGFLRELYRRAAPNESLNGKIHNTSVNVFLISDGRWIIKKWGEICHLQEIGVLDGAFGGDRISG